MYTRFQEQRFSIVSEKTAPETKILSQAKARDRTSDLGELREFTEIRLPFFQKGTLSFFGLVAEVIQ
ncbi:hypothetical protein QE357_002114 [Siphonobacter sp. BAB-5404]|nr:hypothetical protein [Siphonobacter sp. SORGH_AS_0500]